MAQTTDLLYGNTATAAPYGVYQALGGGFGGAGKTESQRGSLTLSPLANKRANEIGQIINAAGGRGTFNEGQFNEAVNSFNALKTDLDSGKISQADYATISDQLLPSLIQYGHSIMGTGSKAADAVKGNVQKLMEFGKDYQVYKAGQELLGRDLTPQEFAQFKPRFADNVDTGRAYVAELAKQEANSPAKLGEKAGQYSGQINKTFQDLLSRGATQEEADYFGRLLATGQVTPYEVNQFVQQLPEYQTRQDKSFREGLAGELGQYDEKAFQRERENILSQYTKAGIQNSSALDFAITEALGKIQEQRGQFLGGLSAQQYGGNKEAARQDYQTLLNRSYGNQDYSRNRSDAYLDYLTQRADQGADYERQKNDYLQFLSQQPKQRQSSGLGGAIGTAIGTGIGLIGGPMGGMAGGQIGGGLGSAFDYLNY